MVGRDITKKNDELSNLINELDIKKSFLFTRTKNLVQFYNGIDLLILTSHSESFPNVIANLCFVLLQFFRAMQVAQKK